MNFAPYQDVSPETRRVLSPVEGYRSSSSEAQRSSPNNPWAPARATEASHVQEENSRFAAGRDVEHGRDGLDEFETSLPLRLDYAACLAYLCLPPVGSGLLLLIEQKSDYVRYHAWQAALLFSALIFLHLLCAWSGIVTRLLFLADGILIAYCTFRAYHDANTLDRFEVPIFGPLASRILDDE
ncbi:hypothetical protein K3495_g10165 [Podosphaera aphanis]|nr:hypothetical protein K3495_g10165 [Podosphaera aphanis]